VIVAAARLRHEHLPRTQLPSCSNISFKRNYQLRHTRQPFPCAHLRHQPQVHCLHPNLSDRPCTLPTLQAHQGSHKPILQPTWHDATILAHLRSEMVMMGCQMRLHWPNVTRPFRSPHSWTQLVVTQSPNTTSTKLQCIIVADVAGFISHQLLAVYGVMTQNPMGLHQDFIASDGDVPSFAMKCYIDGPHRPSPIGIPMQT
jgi:hypothetical protein